MKKVNVLGVNYTIEFKTEKEYLALRTCDAFCDTTVKKIIIKKIERDENTIEDLNEYYKKVIRHELIHAFIYESGLDENSTWATNEEMVAWISIQFDKLNNAFAKVEMKGVV
jgi:hypothetical protein